jgi:hypothetical protein
MRTASRRTALVAVGVAIRLATGVAILALGSMATVRVARAQTPAAPAADPLVAARALFAEALQDEEAGRFAVALEKFERVRAVRDTASVEYRIASCHEGLGEPAEAYRAYDAAEALGRQDPQSADVARAASARRDALAKQVARLALVTPSPPPPAPLEPPPAPALEPPAPVTARSTVPGWIAVGGGAALVAASAILLVVRADDIAALNRACPGGRCPPGAGANELESTRSRALVEGPLAALCGLAGVAAVGVGVVLVESAHGQGGSAARVPAARLAPLVAPGGAGIALAGSFR